MVISWLESVGRFDQNSDFGKIAFFYSKLLAKNLIASIFTNFQFYQKFRFLAQISAKNAFEL